MDIRNLQAEEIEQADYIFRLAFGTFIGLPEPTQFMGDASYIHHRWKTEPTGAFAAIINEQLVGTNLATRWGSFGFFGPLSVHPDYWNQGIAQNLVQAVMEYFVEWNIDYAGLFTFTNSPKHHRLYQKFGFYPRFLIPVMSKSLQFASKSQLQSCRYRQLTETQRQESLKACSQLADTIYPGLNLTQEITAIQEQKLGDTILLWDDQGLLGFALCHCGANTEAGSDTCYIKFATVRPDHQQNFSFQELLQECEAFTLESGMVKLITGINTSHHDAYCIMNDRGFRAEVTGVAMHKDNQAGFSRDDIIALYDWR
ncbi:GNAT family N-acetyltransferase [Calothrix sp. 336/3]|uniref:GNAT family N-acetyltransferase n=1 Tax=Calothrix sp. 336/3 TaxID=1337936 RepID=UPI000AB0A23C|nr:GNAT family N-acetyltransferase [Calothrix sp. 336/3]